MTALDGVRPASLVVTRKMSSNRKVDKQMRFFSTRVKRQKQRLCLTKPRASDIRDAKRKLMDDKQNAEVLTDVSAG